MTDNKNQVAEMGKLGFSLLSFKTKMIIIGVVIGMFLIVIVPVVAIMSIFTPATKNSNQKTKKECRGCPYCKDCEQRELAQIKD